MANIYISSGAFRTKKLRQVIREVDRLGLTHVELSSGLDFTADAFDIVRENQSRMTLLLHNYFPAPEMPFVLNLAAQDEGERQRSVAHCRRALELSAEIGAPFFAAHAGFAMQPRVDQLGQRIVGRRKIPLKVAKDIFLRSVEYLLETAETLGVDFYIENNVVAPFNVVDGQNDAFLLVTPEDIEDIYHRMGHRRFGILMDVGHLKVSAKTLGFDAHQALDRVQALIKAYHLSDNDGLSDSNEPFDEDAWFLPHLSVENKRDITIEAYNLTDDELKGCLRCLQALH